MIRELIVWSGEPLPADMAMVDRSRGSPPPPVGVPSAGAASKQVCA